MKCKKCKCKVNKEDLVIKGINYFCSDNCYLDYIDNQKETKKPITQRKAIRNKSKTNSNTQAKFTTETKAKILIRDKHCILCGNGISDYHHIFYGGQAEHGENRNDVNKGVGLCKLCHHNIHHGITGLSQELRQKCIDYINNL